MGGANTNLRFEIDPLMEEILDRFQQEGNLTTGAIINRVEMSRGAVLKRLNTLRATGYIEYVDEGTALYRLLTDPREQIADK